VEYLDAAACEKCDVTITLDPVKQVAAAEVMTFMAAHADCGGFMLRIGFPVKVATFRHEA
jgi:hypothetical protein